MRHIMMDLETLGTVPGCVILSIGAVEFFPDEGTLGATFYTVINTASCEEKFLLVSEKTREWWGRQSDEAREVVRAAEVGGSPLDKALEDFNHWLMQRGASKEIRLYGNGADFDNPLLTVAYDAAKVKPFAWEYGGRCHRTLKSLDELFGPAFKAPKIDRSGGVHHNALDDAKAQALHLMEIIATVKKGMYQ